MTYSEKETTNEQKSSEAVFSTDDMAAVASTAVEVIQHQVRTADANGVVVAMSGGVDSTVTATLAVEALGADSVIGLGLPCRKSDATAMMTAQTVAEQLGITFQKSHLRPLLKQFERSVAPDLIPETETSTGPPADYVTANAVARFRMLCAYYVANRRRCLVLGTTNRSELLLGYFTKHGDGSADLFPLGGLYKTEVRTLAEHLGVPDAIIDQEPTAGLLPGQTDADDLGAEYEAIDPLLCRVVDRGEQPAAVVADLDIDPAVASRLLRLYRDSGHKRTQTPSPDVRQRERNPIVEIAEPD